MSNRSFDMYVMEHASKGIFWILAISIIGLWFATVLSAPQPTSDTNSKPKTLPIRFTHWLASYLTSHFRKLVAITIYVCVLGLQLLEGWWVLQTDGRLLQKFFSQFPRTASWPIYLVYAASAVLLVLFAITTVLVGFAVVSLQLLCIAELVTVVPRREGMPQKTEVPTEDGGLGKKEVVLG